MTARRRSNTVTPKDKLLPRFTMAFFNRPVITVLLWLALTAFGVISYTTLLKREGFPSVNIPVAIISGTYFANDPSVVDAQVAKPVSDIALRQANASKVNTQSAANFFTVSIQYKEGTDATAAVKQLQKDVSASDKIPKSAHLQFNTPYFGATGPDIQQIDVAISFYPTDPNSSTPLTTTAAKAAEAAQWLKAKHLADVKDVFVKNPFETVADPNTGQQVTIQRTFDRYGVRHDYETVYYPSVVIGISANKGTDVIKLDERVRAALTGLRDQAQFRGYDARVSASFAPSIKDNLSELQRVLLEGLLAILVVGSIVIAVRASLITVISMVTVLVATLGLLYAIGYTLNVITLFALILGLALIVDDTIIMVEAIDVARRRQTDRRAAVREATRKISRAMVAATLTACLCFAPLLFVGGVLGSFIRAIPVTIIASLLISLLVALVFIPFFSRFLLLGKKQMGARNVTEVAAGFEARLAKFIAAPMLWARHSRRKLFTVGIIALLIGFGFIGAGLAVGKNVIFNIFPPTKDTNGLTLTMRFPANTSIGQAQAIAGRADRLAAQVIGDNFEMASYYASGGAQMATEQIQIISYNKREITSPQLVDRLQKLYDDSFKEAKIVVGQLDVGPPSAALTIQLDAKDRPAAIRAAQDVAAYMQKTELKRLSGKVAHFKNVTISGTDQYVRAQGKSIITVTSGFDGNDTTTLVNLAQEAVTKEFGAAKLKQYGLAASALQFDKGQESENQNSFKTLALAFPVLLLVIFILLAVQFRSFVQPLLIFMAIPFSIFGVMLGLYLTDNAISFFSMLGFFAMVGLSIKNTILLTDFANQARRSGQPAIDAAHAALEERFRPLFATSITAVVSLIPLAIASPFWQGLTVVLIFGLLSSTFLVVTVFPYYYLGAEFLRVHISRKDFILWLVATVIAVAAATKLTNIGGGLLVIPASITLVILQDFYKQLLIRRRARH